MIALDCTHRLCMAKKRPGFETTDVAGMSSCFSSSGLEHVLYIGSSTAMRSCEQQNTIRQNSYYQQRAQISSLAMLPNKIMFLRIQLHCRLGSIVYQGRISI